MPAPESLEIAGYRGEPVPNTFFRQDRDTDHLAIILPGIGYTCQAPLLFYSSRLLLQWDADVLLVEYAYNRRPDFSSLPEDQQERWYFADVAASCQAALQQRPYRRVTLVGKSLGTLGMGYLVSTEPALRDAWGIWLTPLLRNDELREQIKGWGGMSLFVIGTRDPHYDRRLLDEVQSATGGDVLVVDGGDHILEVSGDVWKSLVALDRVIGAVEMLVRQR